MWMTPLMWAFESRLMTLGDTIESTTFRASCRAFAVPECPGNPPWAAGSPPARSPVAASSHSGHAFLTPGAPGIRFGSSFATFSDQPPKIPCSQKNFPLFDLKTHKQREKKQTKKSFPLASRHSFLFAVPRLVECLHYLSGTAVDEILLDSFSKRSVVICRAMP